MASSSSASASLTVERNRADHGHQPAPLPAQAFPIPAPPPPQAPAAPAQAIFVQQLYQPPLRREQAFLCRSVTWCLLFFLLTAMFAFVVWVILHPNFPRLHVSSAILSNLTTTSTTATADCKLTLLLSNTNRHLTTIYDRLEIYLIYPSQEVLLSQDFLPPFVQHKRSLTAIETNLSFTGAYLGTEVVETMKQDLNRGILGLGVKVFAVLRYRNGKWKTRSQFMRATCGAVIFGFDSSAL